ncbi:hypothetical protein SASPL_115531 [Salvia splendens]|uniref:CCHC-type domain-containing protein n=1 Tax=Salvia splendens TaxID=180675 RepID=A0A8X8Y6Q7_SALSN|nr:hypothetical protein SASPL_115531 [Salvia splendens]
MRSLLKQQGLWAPLNAKGKAKKVDEKDDEWVTLDEKAHSTIMLCLSDDVIIEVADQETVATLWTKLESLYMMKSLTNKLLPKQHLFRLRMQEEDEDVALILLVSLLESYENFVESFMTGKETLSMEDVQSVLHIREDRQQAASSATENQASGLSATGTGQKKSGKKKSKSKGESKGFQPGDICRYCKEPGHWKYDCPKKKKKEGKKWDANGLATVAEADDLDSEVSLALVADDQPHNNDIDGDNITMANNAICKVVGIGYIRIRTYDGVFCTLNDVRHVPQMTKNLISLSTFDSKGFSFKGEGGVMHIMKGSKVVLTALKRGTLYILKGSIVTGSADTALSEIPAESVTKLWHMRLGHMGERGMQIQSKRDFLSGHKVKNLDFFVKSVGAEESGSVDKQVELQVTHNESESQLQCGDDQHTTAETTGSDIHPEARRRSIAIDGARRTSVKPPQKYGFEDMLAYGVQEGKSEARKEKSVRLAL